ncbi:hypothetical protein CMUS01_02825 [Colletotrichum musicola]|uniref:Uncharacterized protein n=1 Tax=Colletotrichum musicola TaxID=2175873 RepID=A0A8H6NU70_9PEZI|nr:hypothetical protein CMUS01_02825 [Colletotrichum musicola]
MCASAGRKCDKDDSQYRFLVYGQHVKYFSMAPGTFGVAEDDRITSRRAARTGAWLTSSSSGWKPREQPNRRTSRAARRPWASCKGRVSNLRAA